MKNLLVWIILNTIRANHLHELDHGMSGAHLVENLLHDLTIHNGESLRRNELDTNLSYQQRDQ